MLQPPEPILVVPIFPAERAALRSILEPLEANDWLRPTGVGAWSVKDVVGHVLGDDLGRLSRQRDRWVDEAAPNGTLTERIDRLNAEWVAAMRRLSPRLLLSLLGTTGDETQALFESLDPRALGGPVSWAGPEPAPVWLDLAREFSERWHHQQQIRQALEIPVLDDPVFLRPVLGVSAFALAPALASIASPEGTSVEFRVEGQSGGVWTLVRGSDRWRLFVGAGNRPEAVVVIGDETAWRMYFGALPLAEVERRARIVGDEALARHLLSAFALIS